MILMDKSAGDDDTHGDSYDYVNDDHSKSFHFYPLLKREKVICWLLSSNILFFYFDCPAVPLRCYALVLGVIVE